ncbi:MAG: ATP-dependent helicase/nuclease subunit A [Rickettsiales bacterium]|jgi:ATP-dependent helicase/nuclease subunit A
MLLKTTKLQNSASNPANSVFVSASAGSGKTKVLTDRVLRLLLDGVSPAKILCLTFTKVAAMQMQNKIFSELEKWAICGEEDLQNSLTKFSDQAPSSAQLKIARKLFANLLDDNSGLQISTIHSFCQNIIKQFPVEAKTSPNFTVIDSNQESKLLSEAREELLQEALLNLKLAKQINLISARLNEHSFLEISAEIINKKQNLSALKEKYFDIEGVIKGVYEELQMEPETTEEQVFEGFINDKNWNKADLLSFFAESKIKSSGVAIDFIQRPTKENLEKYILVFLTGKNSPRKIITKPILKKIPSAEEIIFPEQERILQFLEKLSSVKIAISTSALLIAVNKIIENYDILKSKNGYLDYSDLIIKTAALLENSGQREWIKYKLDGTFEHILIDESQDTNQWQWNIIKAITEEFFVGIGSSQNQNRTIFIVGDEKQSIYSFQGADPDIFANIFHYYQEKLDFIDQKFLNVELNSSFRSMPAILKAVDQVFARADLANSISTLASKIEHHAIKDKHQGKVELLPIVILPAKEKTTNDYVWELDFSEDEEQKSQEILARIITKKIKSLFDNKKFLASKNRQIEFGDVMILLKERKSNFGNLIIKYLGEADIPVSSADRIVFSQNIIVQDLLSLAKFSLLPNDDLNLACLLKSPFFNISEEELLEICQVKKQNKSSIFKVLENHNDILHHKLLEFIGQSQEQNSIGQFFSFVLFEKSHQKEIIAKFGKVGEEIINQFFKLTIDYTSNNIAPCLQDFVLFVENSDLEIKIESVGQNSNQVFITTIHSAKGLEAPIVFLADTFHDNQKLAKSGKNRIVWDQKTGLPFWPLGADSDNQLIKHIKQETKEISAKEYWRQLYVAMTRAIEELYVCGFGKKESSNDCWYNAIKEAIKDSSVEFDDGLISPEYEDYLLGKSLKFGKEFEGENADTTLETSFQNEKIVSSKNFMDAIPRKEISQEILYPSKLTQTKNSDIDSIEAKIGIIIHKILEFIFDLEFADNGKREEFLLKYLKDQNLLDSQIKEISEKINNVFEKYKDLFQNPNCRAEVPIMAKINGKTISGRIDRLIIKDDEILIIDFKTGKKIETLNQKYQTQMQLYEQVLQKLYPDKKTTSQIVWV